MDTSSSSIINSIFYSGGVLWNKRSFAVILQRSKNDWILLFSMTSATATSPPYSVISGDTEKTFYSYILHTATRTSDESNAKCMHVLDETPILLDNNAKTELF